MSFGLPMSVERRSPIPDQANAVLLAPFDEHQAEMLFPIPADDPRLSFLMPSVRADRTMSHNPVAHNLPYRRYDEPGKLSWGVFANERLVGAVAIQKKTVGLDFDIHIAGAYRNLGAEELALAGITRATFTTGYLWGQDALLTPHRRPIEAKMWIHKDDKTQKALAGRFGFTYGSTRQIEPGFKMAGYELIGGILESKPHRQTQGTLKAARKLAEFRVQAEGVVKIPDKPLEMLERLTWHIHS